MKITVSAPGKIHLLGEHSVVYGKPALLASIDRRLFVTLESPHHTQEKIVIHSAAGKTQIIQALTLFQNAFKITDLPPMEISVTSSLPVGRGLGSSAALAVSLMGALLKYVKNLWNPQKINELAYAMEKIQHGNPSGGDNTVVCFGGLVWYRKETDFLKSLWNLPIKSYHIPKFLLMDTGKPVETTGEMVASVGNLCNQRKSFVDDIFNDQEFQTKQLLSALKSGDTDKVMETIRIGEGNLEKIGVVGTRAQKIIGEIETSGGVAKICGAGGFKKGSGMILSYHPKINKLREVAKLNSVKTYPIRFEDEGVRIEHQETI